MFDIYQILGFLSGIIVPIGYIPYIKDILDQKTKPQRISWLIWLVLGGIAFFSQLAEGANNSLWLPAIQTLAVLIVFILSIKNGMGGFSGKDKISLSLALLGLIVWALTKEPLFALIITVFVDSLGSVLSVIKSYEEPESETLITWVLDGLAGLLAILAVGKIDVVLLIYPTYIFLANLAVIIAILMGKRRLAKL
ncbi:MAG TPA: hypothetical protein PK639_04330 [Candidatus Woesebacteria bacterium]|nr:hypothetical protein [Candidatus Woesebacteria bacterium]